MLAARPQEFRLHDSQLHRLLWLMKINFLDLQDWVIIP